MKSVQVSYELFVDLVLYHLNGEDDFDEDIRKGLEQKLDAMLNRQLYSQYKTAPTEEQREQARQEYPHRRGCARVSTIPKATAGLLLLGSYDRSVPRSCSRQTRQTALAAVPTHPPSPSKNPQIWRWTAEWIFKICSACGRQN